MGAVGLSGDLDPSFLGFGTQLSNSIGQKQTAIASGIHERLGIVFDARNVVLACLGSIHSRPDREFSSSEVKQKLHRAAIHATIIHGASFVESAIATARYAQSATLVRQELEAVEAVRGIRQGLHRDGTTPRIKAFQHLGRWYGDLTALAHLSKVNLLLETIDLQRTGIDPTLNRQLEEALFCLHLVALVGACHDASELRPYSETENLSKQEQLWLTSLCGILSDRGYLRVIES